MDYMTVIEPVMEITLVGTAEDTLWHDLLRGEGLPIRSEHGRARILVSLVDAKYMGIRFQELSVSVRIDETRFFLAQAYNSLTAFAWVERTRFQAPYYKGEITAQPRHIMLHVGGVTVFEAALAAETRPAVVQQECQELQVYLPRHLHPRSPHLHYFHAQMEGDTDIYREGFAVRRLDALPQHPVWARLQASNFQVHEWRIRHAACHSKSKTYQDVTR